ncbi:DUF1553 domain-containing protein [Lacihabitans sp. LS3-19]|uniref:DUF1553 domain-containing protein n=1 Tax=Lacihabitans sp. LS3-19 TaxID=2487335 RepID=UPI0020CE2CA8|nr:DUF1553 domain-containing protein [Lacihabitans sp. LS3-19]MCP9770575.1 DUF1553 domain-containing protein [Lacihabitans sp. LS3-19]
MKLKLIFLFVSINIWSVNAQTGTKLPKEIADAYKTLPNDIDYNIHIKPILSDKCFACHGPDKAKQKAGLRLDIAANAYAELPESPGKVAISPKNLRKSEVFHRIISEDPDYKMPTPKSHLSLSVTEKATIIKWIENGAVYQPHWAFLKPIKKPIPAIDAGQLVFNPIDNFILAKLKTLNLNQNKEADKEILLRRVSLDLTGLPPTLSEIDAYFNDNTPSAYEKQVDRLLASPHYGEKMATDWLDLARFADSHGYTVDRLRDMSPYRDWVIKAFNQNMPYNNFIEQQLAGDLMPNPTKDMIISTAFNRNHQQNLEGGIVEEEFQTEYVMDRTNTFGDAFLGITVGCARCHDHKYDPISQKNYYELYSFFNNVREAGQIAWNDDPPTPTLLLPDEEQEKIITFLKKTVFENEEKLKVEQQKAEAKFENWLNTKEYAKLSDFSIPKANLQGYYTFEDSLKNTLNPAQKGIMRRDAGVVDKPTFEKTDNNTILILDGDVYADLKDVGVFRKSEPFSVGLWLKIPKDMKEGVIFHKSNAERLYNFKGFHLYLKNNRLEATLAHTAPSNAITKLSINDVPRDKWIQITMTYDGSSTANGLQVYLDGQTIEMETVIDQLYKDIIFFSKNEPALQIGGWWRGLGFKGGKVDDIVVYDRVLTSFEINILAKKASWATISHKNIESLSMSEKETLKQYYLSAVDSNSLVARNTLKIARTALADSMEHIPELMVMQEMPKPKKTHLLLRGQYDAFGPEVFPNTPKDILAFSDKYPKNRLGLAQWLADENHPLTARVAVNRLWQNFFGTGLVKTSEDFGNQGEMPTHAELLDWLAVTFRESNWDQKQLNKTIVMSAAYRQDSRATEDMRTLDPENRLLARGPAKRLTAEMIRDNALLASGLLNEKIGGKSIKPYQPEGLWDINGATYKPDSTDEIYRRSLYIVVKRTVPNPTLGTFDASQRSSCIVRRQSTNTPLQALVTLNDPTFLEAAKKLGEQMCSQSDAKISIQNTYKKLTGKSPSEAEIKLLIELREKEYQKFKADPDKAKGWISAGLSKINPSLDPSAIAANTVVASTILNSDATLTKR